MSLHPQKPSPHILALIHDLFRAYEDARKNKRSTMSALQFEVDYERNLFELHREIVERRYEVSPCFCFVSKRPVLREVFAADFRDRVVHHLVYNAVSPIFERHFIHDSYSCRTGKGTSYGIRRVEHFLRSCSRNYQRDCHILKLDISGYFMSIDRSLLYAKVEKDILRHGDGAAFDVDLILHLIRKIIFHDPTAGCVVKGDRRDWIGLPKSKSLFWAEPGRGLPIGNLTSQLFGNIYLNDFDHFVKCRLGCRHYGRYVDDLIIVHPDKEELKSLIPVIAQYLKERLHLQLHGRKIYLQHVSKGVLWLGVFIKPHRKYIRNRTKGNFYAAIRSWNGVIEKAGGGALSERTVEKFIATMNAYLGMLGHCDTYKLRQTLLRDHLSPLWWQYVRETGAVTISSRTASRDPVQCA
ncbi:hypothetical protein HY464_03010 [Candidatus Peregrinibacteria bacterium]|nr:hypothetical protein [Candidatus Peregrinibacteria bacterium]